MSNRSAQYALVDRACLLDGVFVPTKGIKTKVHSVDGKEVRRRSVLFVQIYSKNKKDYVKIESTQQLGCDDQSVLLALVARMGMEGALLTDLSSPSYKAGADAVFGEGAKQLGLFEPIGGFKDNIVSYRSLGIDAGYHDNISSKAIKDSLIRLSNVSITRYDGSTPSVKDADRGRKTQLIGLTFGERHARVWVNPGLAFAMFGPVGRPYVRISLFERNTLKTEAAKLLHAWLCANVGPGHTLGEYDSGAHPDTLARHVWGISKDEQDKQSKQLKSKRRGIVLGAIEEMDMQLNNLHSRIPGERAWVFDERGGIIHVSQPRELPKIEQQMERPSRWKEHPSIVLDENGEPFNLDECDPKPFHEAMVKSGTR